MLTYKVILNIGFCLGILFTAAVVIVLALIPVYLPTRGVGVYQSGPGMYNLYHLQIKHFSFIYSFICTIVCNTSGEYN